MLSYEEALLILNRYGQDAPWVRHCLAVSRVAGRLADTIGSPRIDSVLLRVGALLHDIGRYKTHDPVQHGVEGYRLLMDLGHHREAFICASHVLCGMSRQEAVLCGLPEEDFFPRTIEEKLIPLIDSVVEFDRPTTVEERCRSISTRYQSNPVFLQRFERAADRARSFLKTIDKEFGLSVERVAAEALRDRNSGTESAPSVDSSNNRVKDGHERKRW